MAWQRQIGPQRLAQYPKVITQKSLGKTLDSVAAAPSSIASLLPLLRACAAFSAASE
jgi:hypothetical protein